MGFSDREMVALIGAHAVGRCHTEASGEAAPGSRLGVAWSDVGVVSRRLWLKSVLTRLSHFSSFVCLFPRQSDANPSFRRAYGA